MDNFYLVILAFLAILACFDLFVGVSNDAVNFLNSALGCRIATYRTTMIVASLGVLLGATFSSGMMEIARSGVFHPQMFTFAEIMVIFFAVMVSDVLLLDTFNSLGLPTSTTVSIVFELLGSAMAAALYKILTADGSVAGLAEYINSAKALTIISGILISVVVAFIAGMVVQYIARLIFTFHFERMYRRVGGLFGGFAITAIFYFLVIKGASGSSFMRPEWISWINANTQTILLSLFIGLTVLFQILILLFNLNIFKVVILSGTFSLAFAFAGNDLVNFVGVPLAALDSVRDFMANGTDAATYLMTSLQKGSAAPTFFLLLSGSIMVATLWLSKKAKRVVQTSINLSSSQSGTHEQFGSSLPGRMIVRSSMTLGRVVRQIIPAPVQVMLHSRFKPREIKRGEPVLPFDYVRASINLVLSSILIASATSLKLPLSTTYVTFMVAMGSSFADGAWDRESAVYRISGVLTVISGWFLTALTACTVAGVMCMLVMMGGELMCCALILLAVTLLVRSNFFGKSSADTVIVAPKASDCNSVRDALNKMVGTYLSRTVDIYSDTVTSFLDDNETGLRHLKTDATSLFDSLSQQRSTYYGMAQGTGGADTKLDQDARYCFLRTYTNMREVGRGLQRLTTTVKEHVANRHRVFHGESKRNLLALVKDLQRLSQTGEGKHSLEAVSLSANDIISEIDAMQSDLLKSISRENLSMRGCELYLTFLQFARELVNRYSIVAVLQKELNDLCDENDRRKAKEATEQKTTAATPAAQPSSGRRILQALHLTPRQPKVPDGQSNTPEGKA